ncbi:MAG TPA: hypothetical protein VM008_09625 [Phycisphaerae bacterium]|nr:hypothetical protein [Phycisphaerae bacterium]
MTTHTDPPPPAPIPTSDADFLLAFLKDRDALCPLCKYNLRNAVSPRCPECGREIKLSVGMAEPYILPWALTTIFVAMAASVGIIYLSICIRFGVPPFKGARLRDMPAVLALGYGVIAIPVLILLITMRRRFLRHRHGTQRVLAAIAFLLDALLTIAVLMSLD